MQTPEPVPNVDHGRLLVPVQVLPLRSLGFPLCSGTPSFHDQIDVLCPATLVFDTWSLPALVPGWGLYQFLQRWQPRQVPLPLQEVV
jgi:hypothetical protein